MKIKALVATKLGLAAADIIIVRQGGWVAETANPETVTPGSSGTAAAAWDPDFSVAPSQHYVEVAIKKQDGNAGVVFRLDVAGGEVV